MRRKKPSQAREAPMSTLGELERAVMDALWDADGSLSAYDVQHTLEADGRTLAATTLTPFARVIVSTRADEYSAKGRGKRSVR